MTVTKVTRGLTCGADRYDGLTCGADRYDGLTCSADHNKYNCIRNF
jgi:hypothetical protein